MVIANQHNVSDIVHKCVIGRTPTSTSTPTFVQIRSTMSHQTLRPQSFSCGAMVVFSKRHHCPIIINGGQLANIRSKAKKPKTTILSVNSFKQPEETQVNQQIGEM